MINIYVGKPGMGKTYSLVRLAYKLINEGRDIYSNFYIDFSTMPLRPGHGNIYFWNEIVDIVPIKKGEIFIDECQIYMNSREWKDLPKHVQYKLQQHRKHGVNVHGAVQNIKRIDSVARELVNSVFQLKRIRSLFIIQEFDIEDIDKVKRESYSFGMYFLNKKLANCYNTMYEIENTVMTDREKKVLNEQITESLIKYQKQRDSFRPHTIPWYTLNEKIQNLTKRYFTIISKNLHGRA